MKTLIKSIWFSRDLASATLLTLIILAAFWIFLLPLNQTVQKTFLARFHLASSSFPIWAMQQPIPSMYNFENRVWISPVPITQSELNQAFSKGNNSNPRIGLPATHLTNLKTIETEQINHFPTRAFTFGKTRWILKQQSEPRYYYLSSRYRDVEHNSAFRLSPISDRQFGVTRLEPLSD